MRRLTLFGMLFGGFLMSAATVEADDKKEDKKPERTEKQPTPGLFLIYEGDEIVAVRQVGRTFDEKVKVKCKDDKGKEYTDSDVWAVRTEQEKPVKRLEIRLLGKYDAAVIKWSIIPFKGEPYFGKGATIEDAAGNVYEVVKGGGTSNWEVKLTKKAEVKKEEKK